MKNLAIIPARSGSKGIRDKNIRLLCGKPLMAYTIEAALKAGVFEKIIVSTDSPDYARIAREWGADVPFFREKKLADDTASSWEVVKDVLRKFEREGIFFDTAALLQPTSPLRTEEDICKGYQIMDEKEAEAVISVCEAGHSPLWENTLPEDGVMDRFIRKEIRDTPRQRLPVYYRLNGAIYLMRAGLLLNGRDIYGPQSYALIMPEERSIDMDNELDFIIAESLLKRLAGEGENNR